ncbi:uncharacterized protein KY384_007716 [Bacidia gigantensis]|uniref:uncharacterized protein n=1 Tax=Bacidia gigantensis TaxID=2732470 RepID=UPI001D04E023|nr:uncharacterized protein KY384_007716 [Bacidia gigantensis]KAG8527563.1 hypothetical protein KY384_007716 [Bacidia gigantensis]
MATSEQLLSSVPAEVAAAAVAAARPKRVRTGCLTCRERHLKCDEGSPDCQNCKKSNRECKRGVRLNFIDTQVKTPPFTPASDEWTLMFQDESREIASEYKGGIDRYSNITTEMDHVSLKDEPTYDFSNNMSDSILNAPVLQHQQLPSQSFAPNPMDQYQATMSGMSNDTQVQHQRHASTISDSTFSSHTLGAVSTYSNGEQANETREMLTDPTELLFMQVFVEEVGIWMDSLDSDKYFSRILPYESLHDRMLLNAFLACGARHMNLVNSAYDDKTAADYYQLSSTLLLRQLQNPYRDIYVCATTAVILNVYETMTEKALQRMNHIAGARAMIKECNWNANSVGVGAACFWLNVGMELLSCLHFNWQVAWNPDDWGLDMNFDNGGEPGREEIWTHRMIWILAKIANFRASMVPRPGDVPLDHMRMQNKCDEWNRWKTWIDGWELRAPRTMKPLGHLQNFRTTSKSLFPEVWLVKRTAVVARMFYHTGICLLSQTNPVSHTNTQVAQQMHDLELHHAHMLAGIVAHVKDRGVASVATRCLATCAECLTDRAEQDEVIQILQRVQKETGWRLQFMYDALRRKWGHNNDSTQQTNHGYSSSTSLPPPPRLPPMGIVNPQFAKADFALADHPYPGHYVPPIQPPVHQSYNHF